MASSKEYSNRRMNMIHHRITHGNGCTGPEVKERSVGCNTQSCIFATDSKILPCNTSNVPTINWNYNTENDEEDDLTEAIDKLIFEFLSRPSRRQPYKSAFHWTVNPSTMAMYHVALHIAQYPSENSWH